MTKLNNIVQKLAKNSYKLHSFIIEWQAFILITIVLKIAAMVFSIFAGYFYFNQLFISILNSVLWAKVFAFITLIIIEVLTAISLSKFFKFALRLSFSALFPLVLSFVFFGLSFYSSTNGLALRQSKKVDNTAKTEQHKIKVENIKSVKKIQISDIKEQINTIKQNPSGWTKGVRSTLTAHQLKQIDYYYAELKKIGEEKQTMLNNQKASLLSDLNKNSIHITNESEKYYKIVAFIMVIIFLVNGLLMFFYSRVLNEKEKDLLTVEVIESFSNDIQGKATNLIENEIQKTFGLYFSAIQNSFDGKAQTVADDLKLSGNTDITLGFKMAEQPVRIEQEQEKQTSVHKKNIQFLVKHKALVKTIKQLEIKESETMTNVDVRLVKNNTNALYKGKTLIRQVYKIATIIGLNNIDNNGDINV